MVLTMADIVILHKNFNGRQSVRYFMNWSNAQVAMDKDVEECIKEFGGEIRERIVAFSGDIARYEVYAFFGEEGACGWYLSEEYFEDR